MIRNQTASSKRQQEPDVKFKNDIWYAFTVNPDDKNQFFKYVGRTKIAFSNCVNKLKVLDKISQYILYPEYSEPECAKTIKGPRLHFHGRVKFTNYFLFLECVYANLKEWSMFEIDTIADNAHWEKYMMKQQELWKPMIKLLNLTVPITDQSSQCPDYSKESVIYFLTLYDTKKNTKKKSMLDIEETPQKRTRHTKRNKKR